jgi:long-chain acyl-CoA synthetase
MATNLGELVLDAARVYSDDVAFQVRRGVRRELFSFARAAELARRTAAWLTGNGLQPGDRVMVWAPNMPEYAVLYFGAWLAGIVVVPVDVRTKQEVVDRFVATATPRLGFKSTRLEGTFPAPVETTVALEDLFELAGGCEPLPSLPDVGPDSLCEIAFTSGTTGAPKGVMLTHGNLLAEVEALRRGFPLDRRERALSVLPLSHALEQTVGLLLPFISGVRITYVPRINALTITRTLKEDRITCLIVVPEVLRLLLSGIERRVRQQGRERRWQRAHRLAPWLPFPVRRLLFRQVHQALGGSLRFFGCGGAALDLRVAQAWERMGVRIYEGYGLTETSGAATINNRTHQRLGSAGRPLPGVDVRIAAEGEIQIRGRNVTPGYYENPEQTADAFMDGWLRSGDVGRFDAEGFLHITGRAAFKIVLADGRNVYPEDIEQVLNRHPLVRDSCVVGIQRDGGETVHAVLLTDAPGRADEVVRAANRQLASHQQIRSYSVWPEADFPRTPILKVDRRAVRAALEQPQAPAPVLTSAAQEPARDPLRAIIAEVTKRPAEAVDEQAELEGDLGLDSIGRIELLSTIEEELGRVVDEADVGPQTTVAELRRLVENAGEVVRGAPPVVNWPRSWWARALRRVLLWAAFRLQDHWMRIDVVHPERAAHLPLPSLLIFNYQGPYAPLLILRALPPRVRSRVAVAATARLWQGRQRWQGWLVSLGAQGFPFAKLGSGVSASLDELGRWLDDGYAVIISPEGEPEPEGEIMPFRAGIGLIAVELGVPVVPFKIEGYFRLFPRQRSFPFLPNRRGRVRLIIGEPLSFPKTMSYHEAAERARQALIETR